MTTETTTEPTIADLQREEAGLARQLAGVRRKLAQRVEADREARVDRLIGALPNVHPAGTSGPITVAVRIVHDVPPGIVDDLIAILTSGAPRPPAPNSPRGA